MLYAWGRIYNLNCHPLLNPSIPGYNLTWHKYMTFQIFQIWSIFNFGGYKWGFFFFFGGGDFFFWGWGGRGSRGLPGRFKIRNLCYCGHDIMVFSFYGHTLFQPMQSFRLEGRLWVFWYIFVSFNCIILKISLEERFNNLVLIKTFLEIYHVYHKIRTSIRNTFNFLSTIPHLIHH